jgi:hypothetical protein
MAQIDFVEQRIMRAYTYLFLVPTDSTGMKYVSLARFGQYEVRLVELEVADDRTTWLELFARNTQTAIDSCCFRDLEQATDDAGHLISSARQLHDRACDMIVPAK